MYERSLDFLRLDIHFKYSGTHIRVKAMERGFREPFQGGGSGTGFKPPGSITFYEPKIFGSAVSTLIAIAKKNISRANDDDEKRRARVLKEHLTQRLFELSSRRGLSSERSRENDADENSGLLLGERNENIEVQEARAVERPSQRPHAQMQVNDYVGKIIPGLPKSIDDAVSWWRYGCEMSSGNPLWKFKDKTFRNEYGIPYAQWNGSAQRGCFERIMRLVEHVASLCTPPVDSVYRQSNECENNQWESGLVAFKEMYDGKTLTTADKLIREGKRAAKEAPLAEILSQNGYIEHGDTISEKVLADLFASNQELLPNLRLPATSNRALMVRALMKRLSEGTLQIVPFPTMGEEDVNRDQVQDP